MSNLNMSKLHDIWWNVMIEHDSLCSNALNSWNYRQLSGPFKRGFSFSFATMMKGNHSAHRFRINNVFFFRCRVWCRRQLKWYFIERYCELWFGKMSQSWKKRPYATSSKEISGRLIDGYTWEQWVSETIRQKRTGFSYIFLYVAKYDCSLHSFLYCVKLLRNCTKLKRIVTFNLLFFSILLFWLFNQISMIMATLATEIRNLSCILFLRC